MAIIHLFVSVSYLVCFLLLHCSKISVWSGEIIIVCVDHDRANLFFVLIEERSSNLKKKYGGRYIKRKMISKGNYSRLAHSLVQYCPKQSACVENLRPEDYSSPE